MARPQRRCTLDDYFTIEAMSESKHELHKGETTTTLVRQLPSR
jgi:hypothetical protein